MTESSYTQSDMLIIERNKHIFNKYIEHYRSIDQIFSATAKFIKNHEDKFLLENYDFYHKEAKKLSLKRISNALLDYAPKMINYKDLERGFIPMNISLAENVSFYEGLFEIRLNRDLLVLEMWNKYRIRYLSSNIIIFIDNNDMYHKVADYGMSTRTTLYWAFIKDSIVSIYIDKPWTDEYLIFRKKFNGPADEDDFILIETIYGLKLILVYKSVNNEYRDNYYVYHIYLSSGKYELDFALEYPNNYDYEGNCDYTTLAYGSSMFLTRYQIYNNIGEQAFDTDDKRSLFDYKNNQINVKSSSLLPSSIFPTGLVGLDEVNIMDNRKMIMNSEGELLHGKVGDHCFYFDSFIIKIKKGIYQRLLILDTITGNELVKINLSGCIEIGDPAIFITRKDNRTGYFIWIPEIFLPTDIVNTIKETSTTANSI